MKKQVNGMNVFLWLGACAVIIAGTFLNVIPNDMTGALAICFGFGSIIVFVGNRIPIWKTYFGGGLLLTLLVAASGKSFGWFPETAQETIKNFIGGQGFLNLFIIVLIVGSIVGVNRKLLVSCITRYIPCILAATLGAAIIASLIGFAFGFNIPKTVSHFVLPIMAGGTSGKFALADMFKAAGNDYDTYLSYITATIVLGDIMSCVTATVLGKVVQGKKNLCGEGSLVRNIKGYKEVNLDEEAPKAEPTMTDIASGLLLIFAIFMASLFFNKLILPTIFGVSIHQFAYAVIITVILHVGKIIPENIVTAIASIQKVFVGTVVVVIMFCCGLAYVDLNTILQCLTTPSILLTCLGVVIGAVLGGGLMGWLVGFYPYETAVTAGLCMANAGGAGDVAVLGACNRMNLMPYAQISSRIGNAIILILGSALFSIMY